MHLLNASASLKSYTSLILLLLCALLFPTETSSLYASSVADFRIAAAGDWGCSADALNTVNKIKQLNPRLVLALGDFSYAAVANCWFDETSPIDGKLKIVIGNHEQDEGNPPSLLAQYLTHFHLASSYYSFDYQNVHFTIMNSEINYTYASPQYSFVKNDLANASSNHNIKWIIVAFHTPMYTSPSRHTGAVLFRIVYHPLFDEYGVDLVLQAHNHNYQRSYPITYNNTKPESPTITSASNNSYSNPKGEIYLLVGTGGHPLYDLFGRARYITAQYREFGFLSMTVLNNGTKLEGKFFGEIGSVIDSFTIFKK